MGLDGPVRHLLHHCFGIQLINQETREVLVGVSLTLKLLSIHLVKHMLDYIDIKVLMRVQLNELLFLFVENQHEDVQAAHL